MAWLIKNTIASLILYPCNLLIVLVGAWIAGKRYPRGSRIAMGLGLLALVLSFNVGVMVVPMRWLENHVPALHLDDPGLKDRAEAVVILGAGRSFGASEFGGHDVASPDSVLRVRYGARVARATGKPILVTGGTPDRPGESEGALMAQALKEDFGLDARWIEGRSENTAQSAAMSWQILNRERVHRIFLVTHAFHMKRAKRAFEKAGFDVVIGAPMSFMSDTGGPVTGLGWIPYAGAASMSKLVSHEAIGIVWYWVTGS